MSSRSAATARRAATRTRRAEARERILAAAEGLLRERPYRELSVEQVMAQAGLSRTVFYRHFDGLPELVLALLQAIGDELAAEVAVPPGPGRTRAVLEAAVDAFARHGPFMRAVAAAASHDAQLEAAYGALNDQFVTAIAAQLEVAMADGHVARGDARELARALHLMNAAYLLDTFGRDPGFDRRLALDTLLAVWGPVTSHAR